MHVLVQILQSCKSPSSGKGDPILDTAILPNVLAPDVCIGWQKCCIDGGPCPFVDGKWALTMGNRIRNWLKIHLFIIMFATYLVIVHVRLDIPWVHVVCHTISIWCLDWKNVFKSYLPDLNNTLTQTLSKSCCCILVRALRPTLLIPYAVFLKPFSSWVPSLADSTNWVIISLSSFT